MPACTAMNEIGPKKIPKRMGTDSILLAMILTESRN